MFIELDELNYADRNWRETTRWMKYEEHVLPNGNWSRPQVPFVEYEGFLALKDYLHKGINRHDLIYYFHRFLTIKLNCSY
jgi:hypothetical protein